MKIYFSGAISGGREHVDTYRRMVERMQARGAHVLSAHVADPRVLELEQDVPARVVFDRDVAWIHECDGVVAEVSTPSLGVGFEYGLAVQLGKPVLCAYRSHLRLTKMVLGNPASNLTLAPYASPEELDRVLDAFLATLGGRRGTPS
jgi:nucleoside 2-deoxyribosyltransferase